MSDNNVIPIFRAAADTEETLGLLYLALKRRDTFTAATQMSHLAHRVGKDKHSVATFQSALATVKSWNDPYALLSCSSETIRKLSDDVYPPQCVLDALLDATLAIAPTDTVTAMENLVPALKKIQPGTLQEHQITDHMAHVCDNASPVVASELLTLLMEANHIAYQNENSEHLLHERMIALADMIAPYKPAQALEAYSDILSNLEERGHKEQREFVAARIVATSEIIAPRDDGHDTAMDGVETVLDSMPTSSAAFQQAGLLRSKLTISRDTDPDYSGAPTMTPQEFTKLIGPNPLN